MIAVLGVGFAIHGRGSGKNGSSNHLAADVHYSVGIARCTFVDHSRTAPNYAAGTTTPDRVLTTEIRYPTVSPRPNVTETAAANPAKRHGPFAMIVFAHGYDLTPDTYAALLDDWVRAGYVVAAPIFPVTNATTVAGDHDYSTGESDDVNQPRDVAYVTDALARGVMGAGAGCAKLNGLINPKEIGAAGQSDGGTTVGMLLYNSNPAFAGSTVRFRAAAILSGQEWPWAPNTPSPYGAFASSPPLLVAQSNADECNPPQNSVNLYNAISMSKKWFLDIHGTHHLPPYVGTAPQAFADVARVTTNFFNVELRGESIPGGFVHAANAQPTVATLTTGAHAPVMKTLPDVSSTCYIGE